MTDDDLELRLAAAFRGSSLPPAPYALSAALERVPDVPLVPSGLRGRRRSAWVLVGLAAVIGVGSLLALAAGGRNPVLPVPSDRPSVVPGTRLTYEVQWSAGISASAEVMTSEMATLRKRLDATGVVGAVVTADGTQRILVDLPAGLDLDPFRRILGQRGIVEFVPLGDQQLDRGDLVDTSQFPPLFGNAGIRSALVVASDASGGKVLRIEFEDDAARLFGEYTGTHIGQYFGIVVDGRAASVPVIQSQIDGGSVEISVAIDTPATALEELAQLVTSGPLPVPLIEVGVQPATPGPSPAQPGPTSSGAPAASPAEPQPWPSDVAMDCEPPLNLPGELACFDATRRAAAVLPAVHQPIVRFTVRHDCMDVRHPQAQLDCAVQAFSVVTIEFMEGPSLRVFVGPGGPPQIVALDFTGQPSLPSIPLESAPAGAVCDAATVPEAVTIRIDLTLDHPVWALDHAGAPVTVRFGPGFSSIGRPVGLILDPAFHVIASDGSLLLTGRDQSASGVDVCFAADGSLLVLARS